MLNHSISASMSYPIPKNGSVWLKELFGTVLMFQFLSLDNFPEPLFGNFITNQNLMI